MAELTARELGLDEAQVGRIRFATLLCGVGRDQIPSAVLDKQGPLSKQEWILVRRQPELAASLFNDGNFDDIREWILCHRERPDGRGYPRGLSGGQIPLEARILSVSEAYAAMTSERPYRLALDHESACLELVRCAGTQFDAAVVQAFLRASMRRNAQPAVAAA